MLLLRMSSIKKQYLDYKNFEEKYAKFKEKHPNFDDYYPKDFLVLYNILSKIISKRKAVGQYYGDNDQGHLYKIELLYNDLCECEYYFSLAYLKENNSTKKIESDEDDEDDENDEDEDENIKSDSISISQKDKTQTINSKEETDDEELKLMINENNEIKKHMKEIQETKFKNKRTNCGILSNYLFQKPSKKILLMMRYHRFCLFSLV